MAEASKVRCPLCEGAGELSRSEIAERIATPELRKRLDVRIAQILEDPEQEGAELAHNGRNFEEEVHSWNPRLPMWRRSHKE